MNHNEIDDVTLLLQRRASHYRNAANIGAKLEEIKKKIEKIDKAILTTGYKGDLESLMPRKLSAKKGLGCNGRCFAS